MANFMEGFMRGYDFVDKHKRLTREEQRLEEDRKRNQVLQGRQDELWQHQQQGFADQKELRKNAAEGYRYGSMIERIQSGDESVLAEAQQDPRIQGYLEQFNNPENIPQIEADILTIENAFQGKASKPEAIDAANRFLKPFLNFGTGGENKRLVDLYPSKSGQGFYAELEMDDNGKTKRAPLTPNRSAEDTEVKEIPATALIQALNMAKQQLAARRVELGDMSPIQARQAEATRKLSRQDKKDQAKFEHTLALDRIAKEYEGRAKLLKAKEDGKTGGNAETAPVDIKEFRQHIGQLDSLYTKKATLQTGFDPLTEKIISQENLKNALKTVQEAIDAKERLIRSIAPDLWEKYRPEVKPEPNPNPEQPDPNDPLGLRQ